MAAQIDLVMKRLRETNTFAPLKRNDYRSILSSEDMLSEAEAVGKFRTDDFVIDKGLNFAYTNIARWFVGDPAMMCMNPETKLVEKGDLSKGLYLAGRTGCGKTWAMDIFSFLAREHFLRVEIGNKSVMMAFRPCRADEITSRFMQSGELGIFVSEPLLLINDLGTEPQEVLYMGNRVDVVRQVLERRADDPFKMTIITSNIPMHADAIRERYGDRVASRLRQMCNYMEITGNDKRQ